MANIGNCPKCKQPNEYTKVVCDFCGARLPWADAFQESRKEAAVARPSVPPVVPGANPQQDGGQPMPQLPTPPQQGFPAPPQPGYQQPGYPPQGPPNQQSPYPGSGSGAGYPQGYGPPHGGGAPMPMHGQICERCGFIGNPTSHTEGSFLVELALWFFFCLPGLIYSLWRLSSRKPVCPRCKGAMLPLNSPGGGALYARFYNGQNQF